MSRRGFVTAQPQKRPRSSWQRFCADQPNERWQADVTHWRLADGSEVEILNVIDDHSRLDLASHARRVTLGRTWSPPSPKRSPDGACRPVCSPTFKLGSALKVPGLSGRRCEDRGVRHPLIVVA